MFDFLTKKEPDAITLLKQDHAKVKSLFRAFEKAEDRREKKKIVREALQELKIHSTLEEEIFYPAVRRKAKDVDDIMNEADEEHHEMKVLIAELETMDGSESHYDGKFTVLGENTEHHIEEEEQDMLPKAEDSGLDMELLGQQMLEKKQMLLKKRLPPVAEELMVARSHGHGDSPAQNAKKKSAKGSSR